MIVVDTNTIAYLYLPTEFTASIEKLLDAEAHWAAPLLWRSEFRNILALYLRKGLIEYGTACGIQAQAEDLIGENEFNIDSVSVLTLASASDCSAYDCEFVSLAKALDTKLITADKKLRKSFPEIAITAHDYLSTSP
ncbi:MAG: type II toxin-antitoxin system VapC family toxin [Candidatus Thiodiazotropha sp. (ex Dulcina madagascariensis)]|nr:type II toxin-antitoxin system VapC family toxin [Candidatus Thiodiazotropha sp. (ex Dulcina madagascariensis)]MCU7926138.1 type II toxin-antitoxin system VapC family toxin [Candidatus Thiodiazotropha sp. (ex Dulcina madagascariensis)]